jgi:hypothetical protein
VDEILARIEAKLDTVLLNQRLADAGRRTQEIVDGILAKRQSLTTAEKPDPFGGVPAVAVGEADPSSPPAFVGLPYWETGREPRQVTQEVFGPESKTVRMISEVLGVV